MRVHCSICGKESPDLRTFENRMAWIRHHRKLRHPYAHRKSVKKSLETKRKRGIITGTFRGRMNPCHSRRNPMSPLEDEIRDFAYLIAKDYFFKNKPPYGFIQLKDKISKEIAGRYGEDTVEQFRDAWIEEMNKCISLYFRENPWTEELLGKKVSYSLKVLRSLNLGTVVWLTPSGKQYLYNGFTGKGWGKKDKGVLFDKAGVEKFAPLDTQVYTAGENMLYEDWIKNPNKSHIKEDLGRMFRMEDELKGLIRKDVGELTGNPAYSWRYKVITEDGIAEEMARYEGGRIIGRILMPSDEGIPVYEYTLISPMIALRRWRSFNPFKMPYEVMKIAGESPIARRNPVGKEVFEIDDIEGSGHYERS